LFSYIAFSSHRKMYVEKENTFFLNLKIYVFLIVVRLFYQKKILQVNTTQ